MIFATLANTAVIQDSIRSFNNKYAPPPAALVAMEKYLEAWDGEEVKNVPNVGFVPYKAYDLKGYNKKDQIRRIVKPYKVSLTAEDRARIRALNKRFQDNFVQVQLQLGRDYLKMTPEYPGSTTFANVRDLWPYATSAVVAVELFKEAGTIANTIFKTDESTDVLTMNNALRAEFETQLGAAKNKYERITMGDLYLRTRGKTHLLPRNLQLTAPYSIEMKGGGKK